jgi:RNA polymerase sigma-70 factor (sigma-E family)
VLVIDDDLGHSASGADARLGFARLVSEVGLDHVGIVLGIEMSRRGRTFDGTQVVVLVVALDWPEVGAVEARVDGFAQFVEARQRALQQTAVLLTGDWALAEDLVQTALVRSWPRWERIRRRDDPEIYVRRVMVNTWATWVRRRWRRERPAEAVPDGRAPGDVAAEVAVRMAVRSALGSLPNRQRAVLVLRIFDDLSEVQVAEVLGCAVGTVKSTMARALARLREDPRMAELMEREVR